METSPWGIERQGQGIDVWEEGIYESEQGIYDGEEGIYESEQGIYDGEEGIYESEQGICDGEEGIYESDQGICDGEEGIYESDQGICDCKLMRAAGRHGRGLAAGSAFRGARPGRAAWPPATTCAPRCSRVPRESPASNPGRAGLCARIVSK